MIQENSINMNMKQSQVNRYGQVSKHPKKPVRQHGGPPVQMAPPRKTISFPISMGFKLQ
jgi:hypothetical protein